MAPWRESRSAWWLVWLCRLAVGGVFAVSGTAKAIDPWGTAYLLQEYASLWGLATGWGLLVTAAFALAIWEATLGVMLLLGCYRRSSVWLLLATMAVMLPLSLWIYIADPVAHCGCFGDLWVISNGATFWKNVALTLALVWLALTNSHVPGLIRPIVQWTAGACTLLYLMMVALVGYNEQPMLDFRPWPEGTLLAPDDTEADTDESPEYIFTYEKPDGTRRDFTIDNLPGDGDDWQFVSRRQASGAKAPDTPDTFDLYDPLTGDDVTAEALKPDGHHPMLMVLIPHLAGADISYTYYINELARLLPGRLIGVVGGSDADLETWRDLSAATYPLYSAEPEQIKMLARGHVALVALDPQGRIAWKRTAKSIDGELLTAYLEAGGDLGAATHDPEINSDIDSDLFAGLTWGLVVMIALIIAVDRCRVGLTRLVKRRLQRRPSPTPDNDDNTHL